MIDPTKEFMEKEGIKEIPRLTEAPTNPDGTIDWKTTESNLDKNKEEILREIKTTNHDIILQDVKDVGKVALEFLQHRPFILDKNGAWWLWDTKNKHYKPSKSREIVGQMIIDQLANYQVASRLKSTLNNALELTGTNWAKEVKDVPLNYIQFKDGIFDLEKNQKIEPTPDLFCVNCIPWKLGTNSLTPTMDSLFEQWVGKEKKQTLYEIIAYCCYRDYPIHAIFFLVGSGRNGKGQYLQVIEKFLGMENICSKSLETIGERFQTYSLYKKLACLIGETEFGELRSSGIIKNISGNDPIEFEVKGGDGFTARAYSTLIIASNSLPETKDTSDGFFRRINLIHFENEFQEGKPVVNNIPDWEFENLAFKVCEILPGILDRGYIHGIGTIAERKQAYIEWSNPLSIFIEECCHIDPNHEVPISTLYRIYVQWLQLHKKRVVSVKSFSQALTRENYEMDKKRYEDGNGGWKQVRIVVGLDLKPESHFKFLDKADSDPQKKLKNGTDGTDGTVVDSKEPKEGWSRLPVPSGTSVPESTINENQAWDRSDPGMALNHQNITDDTATYEAIAGLDLGDGASGLGVRQENIKRGIREERTNDSLKRLAQSGDIFIVRPDRFKVTK